MTAERKKSWAEMTDRNSEWLTWPDILEMTAGRQEVTLRVAKCEQGKIKQSGKRVVAVTFDGAKKPLGLNATNAKTITALYGTDKPAEWQERKILLTLFVGTARDPDGGGQCNCVRIRNRKPTDAEVFGAKYDRAIALKLIADAVSLDELESARATISAQRPPKADHADLKAAIESRDAAIKAAHASAVEQVEAATEAPADEASL